MLQFISIEADARNRALLEIIQLLSKGKSNNISGFTSKKDTKFSSKLILNSQPLKTHSNA